jgi:glycosyltransferase involved in cell wall biosynthesis
MDVSVIIPSYNRAHLIGETLRSILGQSLPPREIIVVDDGSQDDTKQVVASFADAVRYTRVRNGGVCRARNHGFAMSTSPWLAFCDSDDLWARNHLKLHAELRERFGEVPFSFSNFRIVRDGVWQERTKFEEAPEGFWVGAEVIPGGWWPIGDMYGRVLRFQPIFPSAVVMSRAHYEAVGGFDPQFSHTPSEDLDFVLRSVGHSNVAALEAATVGVRRHAGNFSGDLLATLQGEIQILYHARANHASGAQYARIIDDEISYRSGVAAEVAFECADVAEFRKLIREVPRSHRHSKLSLKNAVMSLPTPLARFCSRNLSRLSSHYWERIAR